jgi:hypothetical protein
MSRLESNNPHAYCVNILGDPRGVDNGRSKPSFERGAEPETA